MKYLAGYDIGGTKIELVILRSSDKKVIYRVRTPTERHKGYHHILKKIKHLFVEALDSTGIKKTQITSVGFALPGTVKNDVMILGNTRVLEGKPIKKDLQKILGFKHLHFENDANCFAWAEHNLGVGKKLKANCSVGFILGTGMGAGFIIHNKIFSGKRGAAGEIGHIPISHNSLRCYCGQKDCAELYLSGPGFKNYLKKQGLQSDRPTSDLITKYIKIYQKFLALKIGTVINTLDPDYIVLGGGLSKNKNIYKNLNKLVRSHLFIKKSPPPVYRHRLSDSAGSVGASLLAVSTKKN